MRYIVATINANVSGPKYELLDTHQDGGEGEPLILGRFHDREAAELAVSSMNAAPDLLAACQTMLQAFRHIPVDAVGDYDAVEAARQKLKSAISKATASEGE